MFDTIENALESLVGLSSDNLISIEIETSDKTILNSIGRQVFRGKALTDRQRDVVVEKLRYYNVEFENCLRLPLREIDRSKYIKVVEGTEIPKASEYSKSNHPWIKVRFPFSKKHIIDLQEIAGKHQKFHFHEKGSHEHYFLLNEQVCLDLLLRFKNKNFEISTDLLEYYNKIEKIIDNQTQYIPYADLQSVYNLCLNAKESFEKENLHHSLLKIKDRSLKYGIKIVPIDKENSLSSKIAFRQKHKISISSKQYDLKQLIDSLSELDRFPILVKVVDLEIIKTIHNIMPNMQHCVMFREDNNTEENIQFNQYIKNNNMNCSIDNSPEIVYIKQNVKIPKPLAESKFLPKCIIKFKNEYMRNDILETDCDLVISYDDVESVLLRGYYEKI